jgi:Rieske Fe-S protein
MLKANRSDDATAIESRRVFLLLLPLGFIGGAVVTMLGAAFRFLQPRNSEAPAKWINVAPLSELKGDKPLTRQVTVEHIGGWAKVPEKHSVYVLPAKGNQVLSAVCPHEGCEVAWQADANNFACPCHESSFGADGSRLRGPASRGLDPVPTRMQNGTLQVQDQYFLDNSEERITRG